MSIFSKVKRAFGFGSDDDTDEQLFADTAAPTDRGDNAADKPQGTLPASGTDNPGPIEFDATMQNAIFSRMLDIFNSSIPDFLGKTVDKDAQLKYLRDSLDGGVKDYLDSLSITAEKYCEAQWKNRQASMASELENIRARAEEIEKQSSDIKQKQLSADRQKRALTERVHDLESQLAKLESEREQFELENRSLVNRLKVSNVQQEDLEKLQTELQHLRLENQKMRENPDEASAERINALNAQISEMSEGIESLKEQIRVSKEMNDDMRARLSDRDKEISELNELVKQYAEVERKISEIDEVISRKDEKIKSQKKLIDSRTSEIEALRKTIAENLRIQAEREKKLQSEIDALRTPAVVSEMTVEFGEAAEDSVPKISEDDLCAIEQTFESDEWFTKTPPAETPSMRPPESESDFGYQAPKRKTPHTENPDQLSLF